MHTKLVVMQPTSLCNLDCSYCYVSDRQNAAKMSDVVLEATFAKFLASPWTHDALEFLWHAGEPLTAGMAFYERALAYAHKHNAKGLQIRHTIQTNGVLLTDAWCRFLVQHQFCVGVSLDGPQPLHDSHRRTWGGTGSFDASLKGLHRLRDAGLEPGLLCVLTAQSLQQPEAIYDFFAQLGVPWLAFNVEEVEGANRSASTSTAACPDIRQRYAHFLSVFFRRWMADGQPFRVREFDDFLSLTASVLQDPDYFRRPDELSPFAIFTVQRNGDLSTYSPEFAGASSARLNHFVLGNVVDVDLGRLPHSELFLTIQREVDAGIRNCARSCQWFALCGGAYTSNKFYENGALDSTQTTACILHRQTLAQTLIHELAAQPQSISSMQSVAVSPS